MRCGPATAGWASCRSVCCRSGITVAILRAQLLDIRIVVSRSLLYLLLTGGIALVYLGLVAGLGWLSGGLNTGAAVVATVIIAVAFNPLRVRLQRLLDRAFYGARRDPVRALAAVGERLTEVAAPRGDGLAGVLQALCEVLRLPWAAIVVDGVELAAYGTRRRTGTAYRSPAGGEAVGELVVGLRTGESRIAAADERVLALLAAPIGVAVRASRLAEEVARSRERIIASREEERRRLRRDLHDGLGPVLTGVALNAETALRLLPTDPDRAAALLVGLRDQTTAAIADIRRLVDDLGPPAALDALGLEGALREHAAILSRRADGTPLAVSVEMSGRRLDGLPAAVEVAIYRIVTEALTNVVRHSTAQCGRRRAGRVGGRRTGDDHDDGVNLESGWKPGVGLDLDPRTDRRARWGLRDPARPGRRPGVGAPAGGRVPNEIGSRKPRPGTARARRDRTDRAGRRPRRGRSRDCGPCCPRWTASPSSARPRPGPRRSGRR